MSAPVVVVSPLTARQYVVLCSARLVEHLSRRILHHQAGEEVAAECPSHVHEHLLGNFDVGIGVELIRVDIMAGIPAEMGHAVDQVAAENRGSDRKVNGSTSTSGPSGTETLGQDSGGRGCSSENR